MNDEVLNLTPHDVRRYEFESAFKGYNRERVEQFREQVAEEMERLTRLNQELDTKARGFHEQLRAFRERDKALNDALIGAQQMRAEVEEHAQREADLLLREARAEGERIVDEARSSVRRLEEQVAAVQRTHRSYLAQLRALAERHLAEVAGERDLGDQLT